MELLKTFFLIELKMGISASLTVIIILLIRLFYCKIPKVYSFFLWFGVFFCAFNPCYFSIPTSPTIDSPMVRLQAKELVTVSDILTTETIIQPYSGKSFDFLSFFACIWILGFIFLFLYHMICYIRFTKTLATCIRLKQNIYECDSIPTPFIFGFFHLAIYVPKGLTEEELSCVVAHEMTHIKRKDYIWKLIACFGVLLHWYQPLLWIAYHFMIEDMETSCDEITMKNADNNQKLKYSELLLHLSSGKKLDISLSFGHNNTKKRVQHIFDYKPLPSATANCISIFTFVIVLSCSIKINSAYDMTSYYRINEEKASYNRIRWGADLNFIYYRNGDIPNDFIQTKDGIVVVYTQLGQGVQILPDGSEKLIDNGSDIVFYLDSPNYQNITKGVYKMSIVGDSELKYNMEQYLDKEITYKNLIEGLGQPYYEKEYKNKSKTIYYGVIENPHYLIYFTFTEDGNLIEYGLTIDQAEGF